MKEYYFQVSFEQLLSQRDATCLNLDAIPLLKPRRKRLYINGHTKMHMFYIYIYIHIHIYIYLSVRTVCVTATEENWAKEVSNGPSLYEGA